jgi:hypothetical protein
MAVIFYTSKAYWEIARRYHSHRKTSPFIGPTAVRDMTRLQQEVHSQAVLRRINSFISAHHQTPPGKTPDGGGPQLA